ncbi:MAG TPA: TonB-dependent receptor [Steroidobacteraceae bacterium]|nr:TonB-dependent receptor [Steroidobacteraceae bacterium]
MKSITAGVLATLGVVLCAWQARADEPGSAPAEEGSLTEVTITATRLAQNSFDVPAAIDSVPIAQDSLGVNVSESLAGVPGLIARDRQNYAQDEQISIRGFGARAPFGIAGVRIYMDGIPQSQPDGQGEVSQFDLASAGRIEVLRGPFSVLYGNSAGGVIQLFTADGHGPLRAQAGVTYGSFQQRRFSADVQGGDSDFNYNVGASQFGTEGSRGHSAAQRSSLGGKWNFGLSGGSRLTVVLNLFNAPEAQDPLGLTRAQFDADPQGTAPSALLYDTRKSVDQMQLGALYDVPLGAHNSLQLMAYGGHRDVLQFLAIPMTTQKAPTSPGAVVSLGNGFGGIEPRWIYESELLGAPWNVTAGLTYDELDEHREGFNNFVGAQLGMQGALRRSEIDHVYDLDQYVQSQWGPIDRWSVFAGFRRSLVSIDSTALYIPPGGQNGSGAVSYTASSPVGGVLFQVDPHLNLYASFGNGFETPTLDELAYRSSGAAGLDTSLQAASSHSYEIGAKLRSARAFDAQLALFQSDTVNELVLCANAGGRSTYCNAPRTRHQGVEFSAQTQLRSDLALQLSYTYLDATVRSAYLTCSALPCAIPNTYVAAGNRIPGLPPDDLFAQLAWQTTAAWRWLVSDSYVSAVYADDANASYAGAYDLLGIASDYTWSLPAGDLRLFARVDNLANRSYAGSVIVNNTSHQYYEAGPGRAFLLGVNFQLR